MRYWIQTIAGLLLVLLVGCASTGITYNTEIPQERYASITEFAVMTNSQQASQVEQTISDRGFSVITRGRVNDILGSNNLVDGEEISSLDQLTFTEEDARRVGQWVGADAVYFVSSSSGNSSSMDGKHQIVDIQSGEMIVMGNFNGQNSTEFYDKMFAKF